MTHQGVTPNREAKSDVHCCPIFYFDVPLSRPHALACLNNSDPRSANPRCVRRSRDPLSSTRSRRSIEPAAVTMRAECMLDCGTCWRIHSRAGTGDRSRAECGAHLTQTHGTNRSSMFPKLLGTYLVNNCTVLSLSLIHI